MEQVPEAVRQVVESPGTVSDKIRRLSGQGVPRAQIARYLGKRYQHVRNVLESSPAVARPAPTPAALTPTDTPSEAASASASGPSVARFPVEPDGSVRLPAALVRALGVAPGDLVVTQVAEDEITLMGPSAALRRARALFRRIPPADGGDAVETFLAWKADVAADEHAT